MIIRFFTSCIALCLCSLSFGQLTFWVTDIPANTPPKDDIFIAGNFNGWNPGNANYKLSENQNGIHYITIQPSAGALEFKFTRGSWATVEGSAGGGFRPNRTYNYQGGIDTVLITIAGWEGGSGKIEAEGVTLLDESFYMPQLDRSRRIWIYLPPDYDTTSKHYPVIYMHDGQNLFDADFSFAGEWKIDETLNQLFDEGDYGAVVVGIDNGGTHRFNEYSYWYNSNYGGGDGELYVDFLVNTLKPHIDSSYRTLPQREYTAIAGSSMGGLISLSAALDHQDVFSKAGIFSPALWFSDSVFVQVREEGIQKGLRFYFVAGDNESSTMVPLMFAMRDSLINAGMPADDIIVIHHADGQHSEWYWAREFGDAYKWLFGQLVLNTHDEKILNCYLYPNPADDYLKVEGAGVDFHYSIYNAAGFLVDTAVAQCDSVDVSGLKSGIYFLQTRGINPAEMKISRFFKQ